MRAFRDTLDECALQDIGFLGVPFTWDNGQAGGMNVKARLDRGVANEAFLQSFELVQARHISVIESDHFFVLVETREAYMSRGSK